MKKLLRYFPLSKKIQKKDTKSLLITVGIYLAVLFAFFIVKKILVPVKIIGTLVYNLSKLYKLYAIVGIILGVITCYTNIDTEEVIYITVEDIKNLYMSDKKKIAWIVTGVAVLAAAIITPTGLKAERLKRAVDKYVAEDHSNEASEEIVKEEVKEEPVEVVEEVTEPEEEIEEEEIEVSNDRYAALMGSESEEEYNARLLWEDWEYPRYSELAIDENNETIDQFEDAVKWLDEYRLTDPARKMLKAIQDGEVYLDTHHTDQEVVNLSFGSLVLYETGSDEYTEYVDDEDGNMTVIEKNCILTDGRLADLTVVYRNDGYRTYTFSNLRDTKYYHETSDNELVIEEDKSIIPKLNPNKCSNYNKGEDYVTEGSNISGLEKVRIVLNAGAGWDEIDMSLRFGYTGTNEFYFKDNNLDYTLTCSPGAVKLVSEGERLSIIEEFRNNNPGLDIPDDIEFSFDEDIHLRTIIDEPSKLLAEYEPHANDGYIRYTDENGRDVLFFASFYKPYDGSYEETTSWSNTFNILIGNNGLYDFYHIYSKELDVNKSWEIGTYDEDVVKKYVKDHLKNINITITPID